jgi:hypothetical protein
MRAIEWYKGEFDASEYIELFGDKFISKYPTKNIYEYGIITIAYDGSGSPTRFVSWNALVDEFGERVIEKLNFSNGTATVNNGTTIIIKSHSQELEKKYYDGVNTYNKQRNVLYKSFQTHLRNENCLSSYPEELHVMCYQIAYEGGHSSGYGEIQNMYEDIAPYFERAYLLGR